MFGEELCVFFKKKYEHAKHVDRTAAGAALAVAV